MILNNSFNILVSICEYIIKNGNTKLDILENEMLVSIENSSTFRSTLNKWITIDLFNKNNDIISFSELAIKHQIKKSNLPYVIRRIIFEPNNNKNFWLADGEKGEVGASDLVRGCAWYLAQDDITLAQLSFDKINNIILEQTKKRIIQNDTRLADLKDFMSFLGFMWGYKNSLVIDPTNAIIQDIPYFMTAKKTLTIEDFLRILQNFIPVLDGGKYRTMLERELDQSKWKNKLDKSLSPSLERAILRLQLSETVELKKNDDTPSYTFQLDNKKQYSHIKFLGETNGI